jgi:hypothetical protein
MNPGLLPFRRCVVWVVEVWWDDAWREVADAITFRLAYQLAREWRVERQHARVRWREET